MSKGKAKQYYLYRNPTPGTCEVYTRDTKKCWCSIEHCNISDLVIYRYYTDAKEHAHNMVAEYESTDLFLKHQKDVIAFQKLFEVQS